MSALNSAQTSVAEYFDNLLAEITPSAGEREASVARGERIWRDIGREIQLQDALITGSTARSTSIKGFSDVDILVVLDDWDPAAHAGPDKAMSQVAQILKPQAPHLRFSENALQVRFTTGPDVDVLVGFEVGIDNEGFRTFMIPSGDRGRWLPYTPEAQNRIIQIKSDQLGGDFKSLIRLIKWWSARNERLMTSFDIESLACEIFQTVMPDLPKAVAAFFDAAVYKYKAGPEALLVKLRSSREMARRAISEGEDSRAIACWRCLLDI